MTEINIYVKAIDTMESPYYEFYTDTVGTTELTPTNTLYTNNTYIFNRLNSEVSHPFFISDVGYEQESTSAITITVDSFSSGSVDYLNGIKNNERFQLTFNTLTSSDTLYYYCTSHSSMVSTFVLIDPPAAAIFNSYVNVNDNLIVTGNITLDGDISGSGASLYDIPNSGLVNNSITINSQNVALGESVTLIASQWTTDSNAIYYDGGNVGIQTSDPSYALDVSGSVNCSELLVNGTAPSFSGGSGSSYVQLDSTYVTSSETYANPSQNTISLETNNWNLDFSNNIYYNTGNVGIGVDTANFELDVSGSVNCVELLVNGTAPTFGGEYVLYDDTYQTNALDYREVSANISSTTSSGVWDLSDSNTISYTNGNVGIGTTSPSELLTVQSASETDATFSVTTQDASYNAIIYLGTPAKADRGRKCAIIAEGQNYWSRGHLHFCVYDGFGSANNYTNASLSDSRMVITTAGYVGIGTTDPAYELDVSGTINCDELITGTIIDPDGLKINAETGDGGFTNNIALNIGENFEGGEPINIILFSNSTNTSQTRNFILSRTHLNADVNGIKFGYSSNTAGTSLSTIYHFRNDGIATASTWSSTSDERMKFDVNDLSGCLSTIQQLEPKTYLKGDKPNEDRTNQNYLNQESGFLAQDIQKIDTLKHLVSSGSPEIEGVETEMLYLDYGSFIPYLVGAMKEQQIVIDSLTAKNDALQASHDSLQASHDSLQASHNSLKNELDELKALLQEKSVI